MNIIFPRLVFTSPGPVECNGGTYGAEQVNDRKTLRAVLEAGFFMTLPEALVSKSDFIMDDDDSGDIDNNEAPVEADVPPADVPPADVPPADVPPVDVPPADVPPADVPKFKVGENGNEIKP